jgi:uncharacterized membrane protein YbaN (DUF454 family)
MGWRPLWLALGWVALALGAVGAALPLLPTTPFVILAAFAFGKSSPEMRRRLESHRHFGPAIRDWEERGAIRPRYKALAVLLMAASFAFAVALALPVRALAIQGTVLVAVSAWMLTRPSA